MPPDATLHDLPSALGLDSFFFLRMLTGDAFLYCVFLSRVSAWPPSSHACCRPPGPVLCACRGGGRLSDATG